MGSDAPHRGEAVFGPEGRPPAGTAPAEVVVAGHVCLDLVCRVAASRLALEPGGLIEVAGTRVSTGGVVPNSGLALQRLGIRTRLMGAVGDDPFGDVLRAALERAGATDTSGIATVPGASTSYSLVLTPPNGERMFVHDPGANADFDAGAVDLDLVTGARLLHFGYPPLMPRLYQDGGTPLATLLRDVRERGVTVSLDMAMPDPASGAARADWHGILQRALPYTDLFMPSFDELTVMLRGRWERDDTGSEARAGMQDSPAADAPPLDRASQAGRVSRLAAEMIGMGARIVLFKMGTEGVYLRTADAETLRGMGPGRPRDPVAWANREIWAPSLRADVVGTVGAGDATCAGFLAAMLRGLDVEDSLATATAVGAFCVEAPDAVGGVPTWDACRQRLAAGWPRNPLSIRAAGWYRNDGRDLWQGPLDAAAERSANQARPGEPGGSA